MSELKQASKRALIWSLADKFGQQILYAATGIYTARVILKEEFGIMASLAIFTALATVLQDSGLSVALIRKNNASERDYNTAFYFNLAISLALFSLFFLCAPQIASFNGEPRLTTISRVLFLSFVINSFGLIQSTILIKRMDFKKIMTANITATLCSCATAAGMAFAGFEVWALVAQLLVLNSVKSAMLWIQCGWMPRWIFSWQSFREMFSFSSKLLASNIISVVYINFYSFIINRFTNWTTTGDYGQAQKMRDMATTPVSNAFGSLTYSVMANVQDDPDRRRRAMRKTIRTLSFITFPLLAGLIAVAAPLVDVLITGKWADSVPYLQLLCVGAAIQIINSSNGNFIKISGQSGTLLKIETAGVLLLVVFLFATIRYGLAVAICSDIVSKLLIFAIYMRANSKIAGYRCREQLSDIAPYAAISAAMLVLIYPMKFIIDNNYLLLAVQITTGAAFYYLANRILGSTVMKEVLDSLLKRDRG